MSSIEEEEFEGEPYDRWEQKCGNKKLETSSIVEEESEVGERYSWSQPRAEERLLSDDIKR